MNNKNTININSINQRLEIFVLSIIILISSLSGVAYATNPPIITSLIVDDPDDLDDVYSVDDTITILFDSDTNMVGGIGIQTKIAVDDLFNFTELLGQTYRGQWVQPDTFTITIRNINNAEPLVVGSTTVTPTGITPILSADETSIPSTNTSPVLSGDFGEITPVLDWILGSFNSIYYDAGNVGIGTTLPDNLLSVNGIIESTSGGFKFPDGTTQSTASTGDITGLTAGIGLSGGGTIGDVTLDVDTSIIQNRVTGSCSVGSSINTINEDGTVICEIDDIGNSYAYKLVTCTDEDGAPPCTSPCGTGWITISTVGSLFLCRN